MSFTAVILDDEPLAVEALRQMAERTGMVTILGSAADAAGGIALFERLRPQVAFVDISMPGMSGLELARSLRTRSNPPLVVLVTAHDHLGTEAFDCAVVDYVLKPLKQDRLTRACERAAQLLAVVPVALPRVADDFWVPHRGSIIRVPLDQVRCFQAERDYVRLHVEGSSYLMRSSLAAIESRIDGGRFVRIHRSTILRLDRIRGLRHQGAGKWLIIDADDRPHVIGRSFLGMLRARLQLDVPLVAP